MGGITKSLEDFGKDPVRSIATFGNPLSTVLPDPVNQAIGIGANFVVPGLGTAYSASSSLANGGSIGNAAKNAAISLGTQQLGGALGNQFPETFGSVLGTGGNTLTDALGYTSGAGSLSGSGIGNYLGLSGGSPSYSNYTPSSGYSSNTGGYSNLPSNFSLSGGGNVGDNAFSALSGNTAAPLSAGGAGSSFGGTSGGGGFLSGASSYLPIAAAGLGALNSLSATDQAKKALLESQGQAAEALAPYSASGEAANSRLADALGISGNTGASGYGSLSTPFTPGDLTQTPGYQFQLEQGNKALDRKNAASGNYASGAALKEAQQFGQGLANQTYNDAYNRDLQTKQLQYNQLAGQSGQGANTASALGNIYGQSGSAIANSGIAGSNILNQALSSALSGAGAYGKTIIGYKTNGQPIYG